MAKIKVEPTRDRDDVHTERRGFNWWLLAIPVLLGLLLIPMFNRGDDNRDAANYNRPAATTVAYQNHTYVPQGDAITMTDTQLVPVGRSAEGQQLFSMRGTGGGGGGMMNNGTATGPLFIKVADGRYQRLVMNR